MDGRKGRTQHWIDWGAMGLNEIENIITINLEGRSLQCVEDLLLYLLQLILHLDDDVLHLGIVALGTGGVYLTAHLLGDETELLANAVAVSFIVSRKYFRWLARRCFSSLMSSFSM